MCKLKVAREMFMGSALQQHGTIVAFVNLAADNGVANILNSDVNIKLCWEWRINFSIPWYYL